MRSSRNFTDLAKSAQMAADALSGIRKHFGDGDSRQWSDTHVGTSTAQKPHGNRPGQRTQEGVLSSLDLTPQGWEDLSPKGRTDYFVRATGYSTPVIEIEGEGSYLAPPGAKMLPEKGAGENVEADDTEYVGELEANTQLAQGIEDVDKLDLPEGEEEQKRYLEAAAEHRQNDYKGPTTPRYEEMFGDKLRSEHPARQPRSSGGRSSAEQQRALRETVASKGPRLRRLGRHFDEAALTVNLLQNVTEAAQGVEPARTAQHAAEGAPVTAPGARTSTAEEAASTAEQQPAQSTAERNAERQEQRAEERRDEAAESAKERQRRLAALRTRGRRVENRLP